MTFIWCIVKTFLCFESDFSKSGKITVNNLPKQPIISVKNLFPTHQQKPPKK